MKSLQDEFGGQGLQVLSVNSDNEDKDTINKFVRSSGMEGVTVLLNGRDVMKKTYKTKYFGTIYLIDRTGKVRWSHWGWSDGDEKALRRHVQELL